MSIQLSEIAATRVQNFLANRGKGLGLRLGVKTTGCSGMAYVLEFVEDQMLLMVFCFICSNIRKSNSESSTYLKSILDLLQEGIVVHDKEENVGFIN